MRKKGGPLGLLLSLGSMIAAIALVWAFITVNNITSVKDFTDFLKSKSGETSECASGDGWKCNPLSNDEGDSDSSGGGDSGDSGDSTDEADKPKPASDVIATLDEIPAVTPGGDYSRGEWKHWTGSPCNTREELIKSSGKGVKLDDCKAVSGTWSDPYTGDEYSDASKMDVDHVIPLGYAAKHGGAGWDEELKTEFANDTSQLLLVGASPNRAKGDRGPSAWMPPSEGYHCDYAKKWVSTADKYSKHGLGLEQADKDSLRKTLEKCG